MDKRRKKQITQRYDACPINCRPYLETEIATLSDYLAVFHSLLDVGKTFWFRGHDKAEYSLVPSALRYRRVAQRDTALGLIADMKRYVEMKLRRPPKLDDHLGWMQVAQHYGLPTRLLDWTENAAVALFFACYRNEQDDGLVAVLNPTELNQTVDKFRPRIFDQERDSDVIEPYFALGGKVDPKGRPTIAINPALNTERIALQQGVFTLHGTKKLSLDQKQVSSLTYVPILKEHKLLLLHELQRVGIGEMYIFPEPEHVCSHLRKTAKL
jgi:hypothetical protein